MDLSESRRYRTSPNSWQTPKVECSSSSLTEILKPAKATRRRFIEWLDTIGRNGRLSRLSISPSPPLRSSHRLGPSTRLRSSSLLGIGDWVWEIMTSTRPVIRCIGAEGGRRNRCVVVFQGRRRRRLGFVGCILRVRLLQCT